MKRYAIAGRLMTPKEADERIRELEAEVKRLKDQAARKEASP